MRLELNTSTDLALRAMRDLCAHGDRLAGAALAQTLDTSRRYLPQIMAPLVHRGWVTSKPGPNGGYELAAKVENISVLDVIEAMEGPTDTETGVLSGEACGTDDPRALHEVLSKAREGLLHQLDSISLADAWGAC